MADRKGATGEKSYRSRNRAISALVQNTTNKNIVTTDLSGGTDSASIITLIQSANDSNRTAGSINSVHRITALAELDTLATHTGLGVLNGTAKVGDIAYKLNPFDGYVLTDIAATAAYQNSGFHVQTDNGTITRMHFDVVPSGQLPSQNFAIGSTIAVNSGGGDVRTVTGVSDTGGNYSNKGYLDFTPSDQGYAPGWDNKTVWVSTANQSTWKTLGIDSAIVIQLIDSSYIQARTTAGTDSASVINLITNNTTTVTKIDSFGALALIDSVAEADFAYNDINHDVYFATSLNPSLTVSHSLVFSGDERITSSGVRVSPFQTITVTKTARTGNLRIYGAVHSVAALNATFPNSTAGYFSAYQPNISIRVPGESSNRTINALIVAQTTGTFVDNGDTTWTAPFEIKGVLAVSGTDISNPTNIANTFYAWTSGLSDTNYSFNHSNTAYGLFPINASSVDYPIWTRVDQDSGFLTSIIDSAYVSARAGGGVDSAATLALINSRISDSAVSTAFTYTYTATAGQTAFSGNDNNSNYLRYNAGAIQAFQNGVLLVDSADYVASTGTSLVLNTGATVGDIINITKFTGVANSGTLSHTQFKYISATPATTFSGADVNNKTLSYNSGEVQVYLNGLLLVDSDDYVAGNGTSVVLRSATDSGDVVNISKFVQGSGGMAFRSTNFVYTTGSPTTTILGSDDNNLTLSYINDQIQVFRNGILLIDSADYTATNGTTIVLNQATNAADTVAVTAFRGVLTGGLDSGNITNLVDASYVQARQSAAGIDSSKTINLIDSAYVQARQTSGGGLDSAAVIALSPTNSTSRSASSNPILTIEAGTTLQHSGWTDSASTNSPPYVNVAQIRKGGLVQVGSNLTGSQATQSLRERQQYMYQNCFYVAPSANTGIDILRYTMLDVADDAVPSNSEVYGRVNWICWAGGHTNATGNGSIHTIGTIDYNGASPSNGTSHTHADGNSPSFAWNHSNFVSTLNIQGSGNSANVGYFTVFVQILFTHGAGARGSSIYYKLEELV